MNNVQLRNLVDKTFRWGQYRTLVKKVSYKLYDRAFYKVKLPVACQISTPINIPIRNAIRKQK